MSYAGWVERSFAERDPARAISPFEVLNARQIDMAERLGRGETLTSRACEKLYDATRETTYKDFKVLLDVHVAERFALTGRPAPFQAGNHG